MIVHPHMYKIFNWYIPILQESQCPTLRLRPESEVPPELLRWTCDPESLDFETTAEVEPLTGIIGQGDALDSLRFGLEFEAVAILLMAVIYVISTMETLGDIAGTLAAALATWWRPGG